MNEQEYFPDGQELVPRELAVTIMKDISEYGNLTSTTIKMMEDYQKDKNPRNSVIDRLLQIVNSPDLEMEDQDRQVDTENTEENTTNKCLEEALCDVAEDTPSEVVEPASDRAVYRFVGEDVEIPSGEPYLKSQWDSLNNGDIFLDKDGDVCVMTEPFNGKRRFIVLRTASGECGDGGFYTFTYFRGIKSVIVSDEEPFELTIETPK